MTLREELYKEATEAIEVVHPQLVNEFLTKELHKSAKQGEFFARIGANTRTSDNITLTEEEVREFAKVNDLDFEILDNVYVKAYILSFEEKKK